MLNETLPTWVSRLPLEKKTPKVSASELDPAAAYVLFYLRADLVPASWGGPPRASTAGVPGGSDEGGSDEDAEGAEGDAAEVAAKPATGDGGKSGGEGGGGIGSGGDREEAAGNRRCG